MKRIILMGGRPWVAGDKGEAFTRSLFRHNEASVKIAFCIFAQPESDWPTTEKWNKSMLDKFKGSRTLEYKTTTQDNFEEVSQWADIVYLPGGDPFKLIDELKDFDLEQLWDNKVLAGSSAGADLFCKGFTYLMKKKFADGLGWLNMTVLPHYRDPDFRDYTAKDWDWAEQTLMKEYPDVPIVCIPEGESVEFLVK